MLPAPSTSTAAPRGKRCTMCLCCDAVIEFAGELLCAACDDGTHPPPAEQRPAAGATVCGASTAAPATLEAIREMATAAAPAQPQPKGATVSTPSKNKPGTRITPETRRAILAAPPDESNGAVARRLGISDGSVWLIRKRAGIKSKAKSGIRPLSIPAETKPEPAPDTALPITMTVTERTLDARRPAMSARNPLVEWSTASVALGCSECRQTIEPGDPVAIYDDQAVNWPHKPIHTTRSYCAECGELLEDSLNTTGDLE